MQLYNTMSADERKTLILKAGKKRLTLSFYQYHQIEDTQSFRDKLFLEWDALGVLGRTYIASEGINGQLSLPADNLDAFRDQMNAIDFLKDIRLNIAIEQDDFSFLKLKVKVRNKIVADGLNDDSFDVTDKGVHLKAKEFNEITSREDTILIDMRNHYESEVGHFEGAITPDVDTFRESLPIIEEDLKNHKEDKNLVMYCTGGIRCEKASAYFKHKGFKNVYQLEGGIIEYARQVKDQGIDNKFVGKNFVFDERRGERITDDVIAQCHQCGEACDMHHNCDNMACHLLFIQCESCKEKMLGTCSDECREIAQMPIEEQRKMRKGLSAGKEQFSKGRSDKLRFKKNKEI